MNNSYENFTKIVSKAISSNARAIHLKTGHWPFMRVLNNLLPISEDIFTKEDLINVLDVMLDREQKVILKKERKITFTTYIEDIARAFVHVWWDCEGYGITVHLFPTQMPIFADWNIPESVLPALEHPSGLILISGNFSQGKTSTAYALMDFILKKKRIHLVTFERNIPFVLKGKGIVSQKELKVHFQDYEKALEETLKEDPDVIFVDEPPMVHSLMDLLFHISDAGKMVFITIRASSSVKALYRIFEIFPDKQEYYRNIFADNIKLMTSQFLIQSTKKEKIIPIFEVVLPTTGILNLIREGKINKIPSLIEAGSHRGMQTFDQSIVYMYSQNLLSYENAISHLSNKKLLQ